MLTKEIIVQMLKTDKRAVARALVVLNARQTADEQITEHTRYLNGRGFRPCHARMGTNMAKFFLARGYLTDKQIAYWRSTDKTGAMRIGIYAGQLLEEAINKSAKAALVARVPVVNPGRDFGNDMEHKMVLEERLSDVLDSDDPELINPIAAEINEIDAFWAKVRKQG